VAGAGGVAATPLTGILHSGAPPAAASGPSVSLGGSITTSNGGTGVVSMLGSSPFQQVFVSVGQVAGGVTGFWQIDLPAAVTSLQVALNFGPSLPAASFSADFQVASPAGVVGPKSSITVTQVAPGPACTSAAIAAVPTSQSSGGTVTFTVTAVAPAGCRWVAFESDTIPFQHAIKPNNPWILVTSIFTGAQTLTARVFNTPADNPSGVDVIGGIAVSGVDATGAVVGTTPIASVTFVIKP
jgi:hypothetical protein